MRAVLAGNPLEGEDLAEFVSAVAQACGESLAELLRCARDIRQERLGRTVSLCAIVNARSGRCPENCSFCAQSAHFRTNAPVHAFLTPDAIENAARAMRELGATRFGIVSSGLVLSNDDFFLLLESVRRVSGLGLCADASCGLVTPERFAALKSAGLSAYHHNLETARSFFPAICTTHDYEADVQAIRDALTAGLCVCSGGIFGLGESWEQRAELALTLRELGVTSVPVNFLTPIPGTPMADRLPLSPEEALKIVALLRFLLPDAHLRICGGRATVFGHAGAIEPLTAGASGLMIGNCLTTKGPDVASDQQAILDGGWTIDM